MCQREKVQNFMGRWGHTRAKSMENTGLNSEGRHEYDALCRGRRLSTKKETTSSPPPHQPAIPSVLFPAEPLQLRICRVHLAPTVLMLDWLKLNENASGEGSGLQFGGVPAEDIGRVPKR